MKYFKLPAGAFKTIKFSNDPKFHHELFLQKQYNGLIKCKILPSREGIPNLVITTGTQNAVSHCYSCAINSSDEKCELTQAYKCEHTDEQRSHVGVFTCYELLEAVKHGDKILEVYEILHCDEMKVIFDKFISRKYASRLVAKKEGNIGLRMIGKVISGSI
jgi:hypothetical protein